MPTTMTTQSIKIVVSHELERVEGEDEDQLARQEEDEEDDQRRQTQDTGVDGYGNECNGGR